MTKARMTNPDLVDIPNFLQAIRDAGYQSASAAICELIDNSIQANARNIRVILGKPQPNEAPSITVDDDGDGMALDGLERALQFGGSSRFNERTSLGRYGMGLPAAGLSIARRIVVETTRLQSLSVLSAILDIDSNPPISIARNDLPSSLPGKTGTKITLQACDRLDYVRMGNLRRALLRALGQSYRHFLMNGVSITVDGQPVMPVDPLMRWPNALGMTSKPFGQTQYIPIRHGSSTGVVEIDFVELPIEASQALSVQDKRRAGITGGPVVSVLRANREIASGWLLCGTKRRENYDDWWRCEVRFDPHLDELFGITYTKQGIRPSTALRDALEPEIEATARTLNRRARERFEELKVRQSADALCEAVRRADRDLPPLGISPASGNGAPEYRLVLEALPSMAMLDVSTNPGVVTVSLNSDHALTRELDATLASVPEDVGSRVRRLFHSVLVAAARTDCLVSARHDASTSRSQYRELWGSAVNAIIRAT